MTRNSEQVKYETGNIEKIKNKKGTTIVFNLYSYRLKTFEFTHKAFFPQLKKTRFDDQYSFLAKWTYRPPPSLRRTLDTCLIKASNIFLQLPKHFLGKIRFIIVDAWLVYGFKQCFSF